MTEPQPKFDYWRIPALILWWVFLVIGALPEEVFWTAREIAGVVTQRAMVNSPNLITLAFALYLGLFSYRKCRDAGLSISVGQGRAIQLVIIGLIAFLPFPLKRLLEVAQITSYSYWDTVYIRGAVYAVWVGKLASLLYLAGFFFRMYALGHFDLYRDMVNLFPSAKNEANEAEPQPEDSEATKASAPLKDTAEKNR